MSKSRCTGSTVPVTGSGESGSGPQAAKTIIWLLLGVGSGPSAKNNKSLISGGSESQREQRGGVKSVYLLLCCVGGLELFFLSFFFALPPTRLHSPGGLPTPEGVAVTLQSVCGLLSCHRQTHVCANIQTADEATGGISQCHYQHVLPLHTHAHTCTCNEVHAKTLNLLKDAASSLFEATDLHVRLTKFHLPPRPLVEQSSMRSS